ncbi:MAG TPA: chitinase, partial [Ktedonobacteraceae bacterium]
MKISQPIWKTFMMSVFIVSVATVSSLWTSHSTSVHAASVLPSQLFAPYAELGQGASLQSVTQSTGQKYFTLAFMLGNGCQAEWNGTVPLSQTSTYFPSLSSDIQYIRGQGGDVIVSFGGAAGTELAQSCTSASSIQAQYQAVVNQYQLSRLDFDIESGEQGDSTTYDRRNIALAALEKANPGLTISFTLPSATTGLLSNSIGLLQNAISHGVTFSIVNLMTMDYGSPQSDMGQQAVNAGNGLHGQLASLFPSKSSSQLWSMVGITPMIGRNDESDETFSTSNASTVLSFAQTNKIGELAFWAVSRDNGSCPGQTGGSTDTCSGISQSNYAFTNIFKVFTSTGGGSTPTPTPTPSGSAPIGKTIWLRATNNSDYVSTRIDQTNNPL